MSCSNLVQSMRTDVHRFSERARQVFSQNDLATRLLSLTEVRCGCKNRGAGLFTFVSAKNVVLPSSGANW